MATTEHFYTGNNSTTSFAFTFPYLSNSDVKVELDNVVKTENSSGQTNNDYTINNTNIVFNSAPGTGVAIHIYRSTNVDTAQAQYAAGSSIRAADLNNNQTQVLYSAQEAAGQKVRQGDLKDNIIVSSNIIDGTITSADLANSLITTEKINADAVTGAKIADDQINSEHYIDGSIDTQHIADSQITTAKIANSNVTTAKIADSNVTTAKIAADAITGAKIANDQIDSEHYVDGSIDTAHIANGQITSAKIADGTIIAADLASNSVTTDKITDANVTTAKIADDAVTMAKLAGGTLPSDISVNTHNITNGTISTDDLGTGQVTTVKIADNAVTMAKLAGGTLPSDININTHNITNGSILTDDLGNSIVTTAKIADGNITTAKIETGAVTTAKIGAGQVILDKLADNSVNTNRIIDANVTNAKLASNSVTTSKITDANVTTVKVADANITLAKLASDLKQTTISDSDTQLPTSGAVVDYVAAQIAPIGGLEVIATDAAFPNTQPQAGVVISIADAGGLVVNGSGTSTTGRTVGGSTVTINNIASNFNSSTVDAGVCFQVSSTGSGQVYNYHKATLKEADLLNLSNDINDFGNRYRVGSSNPTSGLDAGDLFFNTSTQKLLVYNSTNSAWEEAQSVGNFFISTFSESFDGSRTAFTVSNAPSNAQQLVISINGVIQKPNSGTGQPSEGFTLSGSTVTFSSAIPSGSDYFAIVLGSTVNIGTPSNGTVTTDKLTSGAVTTVKIADDAVTGDKIATNLDLPDNNKIRFGTGNDLQIFHNGTRSKIQNETGDFRICGNDIKVKNFDDDETYLTCVDDGAVELYYNNSKKFETTNAGVKLPDGQKVEFGNDDDLEIFHYQTDDENIINSHKPLLFMSNGNTRIQSNTGEDMIKAVPNGAVELYHNNSKKLETTSWGAQVSGNLVTTGLIDLSDGNGTSTSTIALGDSDDLKIYHNGTNSFIVNNGGTLEVHSKASETSAKFVPDGQVELYYDNSKKFETTSSGVTISSDTSTGSIFKGVARFTPNNSTSVKVIWDETGFSGAGHFQVKDGVALSAGNSSDLLIYHDGTNNIINDANSAKIKIQRGGSDVWELKSTGLQGIDNQKLMLGNADDLQIYHNGSNSIINNNTGDLYIQTDGNLKLEKKDGGSDYIHCIAGGAVELHYDGNRKFETQSGGAKVTGTLSVTGAIYTDNEFNMTAVGNKFIDTAHKDNTLHFRRINDGDGGHSTHCTVSSGGEWSANFNDTSDEKLKENITAISDGAISKVKQLRPVNFDWKETDKSNNVSGFIAQEIKTVLPNLVYGTEYDPTIVDEQSQRIKSTGYSVNTIGIVAHLTKALQEAITKIETLETKVSALEAA